MKVDIGIDGDSFGDRWIRGVERSRRKEFGGRGNDRSRHEGVTMKVYSKGDTGSLDHNSDEKHSISLMKGLSEIIVALLFIMLEWSVRVILKNTSLIRPKY